MDCCGLRRTVPLGPRRQRRAADHRCPLHPPQPPRHRAPSCIRRATRWSSYPAALDRTDAPDWLTIDRSLVLGAMNPTDYRSFVETPLASDSDTRTRRSTIAPDGRRDHRCSRRRCQGRSDSPRRLAARRTERRPTVGDQPAGRAAPARNLHERRSVRVWPPPAQCAMPPGEPGCSTHPIRTSLRCADG